MHTARRGSPDPFTGEFPFLRRCRPRPDSTPQDPTPFLHQLQLLFASWVPDSWTRPTASGPGSRRRLWTVELVFWTFLSQILNTGSACHAAVREARAYAQARNLPLPEDDTAAYCLARQRLPLDRLRQLPGHIASLMEQRSAELGRWRGHPVRLLDGTTLTADDTPANQDSFPQPSSQAPGCGFPMVRVVAWFCLASGALLGWATGTYLQSELSLAWALLQNLQPGELILADRQFANYHILARAKEKGAFVLSRLHASRRQDLRQGRSLGRGDRLVRWPRPAQVAAGFTREQWLALPEFLEVRLVRYQVAERGSRSHTITLVTTLLDPLAYPPDALAWLYRRRWQVELGFRHLKSTLAMDHLAVRSPAMVERSLAMHLVAYQLTRALMLDAALLWWKQPERLSFQGSLDTLRHYAQALFSTRSHKARSSLVRQLYFDLANDVVPERPGRREPRALKRRPKAFPHLTCHRNLFKEDSAKIRRRRIAATKTKARS